MFPAATAAALCDQYQYIKADHIKSTKLDGEVAVRLNDYNFPYHRPVFRPISLQTGHTGSFALISRWNKPNTKIAEFTPAEQAFLSQIVAPARGNKDLRFLADQVFLAFNEGLQMIGIKGAQTFKDFMVTLVGEVSDPWTESQEVPPATS